MIKSQITLKQLEAFAFVIDTGTFRAAAAALGTTQPNISARISALEGTLGVLLLHRDAGPVRLTEKGAGLLAHARAVLRAGEALLDEAGRHDLIDARLRLGVTELVACTWLQPFLRRLKLTYPNVRVELEVDVSRSIDEHLMEGQLDLALQTGPFKRELAGTKFLGEEAYCWVVRSDMATPLQASDHVGRFFTQAVLTHAKHTQASDALHAFAKAHGYDQSRIVHSSALTACIPMVCEGLGIALLPKALVHKEIASGLLTCLKADWTPAPLTFHARYNADRAPLFVVEAATHALDAMRAHQQ